jgi:hypothetical protein
MLLGSAGARSVPVAGGNQVPVAAVTNLLGMLANRASAEWEAIAPSAEVGTFGEGLDFAPEVRAEWLYGQLAPPEPTGENAEGRNDEAADEGWLDELYDELEAELVVEAEHQAAVDEALYEAVDPESWSLSFGG